MTQSIPSLETTARHQLVLGIGTGRCGTDSLAALLDNQTGGAVTHERFKAQVPWGPAGYDWLRDLIADVPQEAALYGDVSLYWLPQVERLLLDPTFASTAESLRVVALQRNREDTVRSYMQKTQGPTGRNHWMVHDGTTYVPCDLGWDKCYPKFRAADKREALSMYWAAYYGEVDRLAKQYPEQVRCFALNALNTTEGQRDILGFVGIPEQEQVLKVGIRKNSTPTNGSSAKNGSALRALFRKFTSFSNLSE